MTTQEKRERDLEFMKQKLKDAHYWSTEGDRPGRPADYAQFDRLTPEQIRNKYEDLINPWPDR